MSRHPHLHPLAAALAAAFLAAADGESVTMAHLMRATQREFQKMGRIIAPGELAVGVARATGGD